MKNWWKLFSTLMMAVMLSSCGTDEQAAPSALTMDESALVSISLAVTGSSSIIADGSSTTTLKATAKNYAGSPLAGKSLTIAVPLNGGTIDTNPQVSDAAGEVIFTLTSSMNVGLFNYTVSSGAIVSNSAGVTFSGTPINSISLVVTGSNSINADGVTTTTIEATAVDASLNPLANRSLNLAIPTDGGSTTNPAVTNASGVATFTLTSSIVAGVYSYTASAESITSNNVSVTFVSVPVATVNLIVSGVSSIVADGVATTTLEATVLDGSANPLPNRSVTINIPTDGGTISVNPVVSNASGVASFTLTSSLVVGVYGYTATSELVNSGNQNVTFTAIPVDSVSLAVTGSISIAANGAATTTLEATVLDASSNPLAGRNVTLNIPTDGGTTANPAVTNASGVASFTLTSSLVAGLYNYTATSEAVNSNSVSVTFVAPVATVNLIVSGVSSIVADGVATTTLEATVLDGSANPLPNRSVTINIPTDGGTIAVNPVNSNASGVASFTLTSSLVVGVYGYTATSESVNSGNQNVTFTAIPVDSVSLAVTGSISIAANGAATTTLEATVLDASSNPLAGRNVTLNIPTDGGTTANPAVTNASGVASFTLTSSLVAGLYNYTATSEAVNSNSESVTFVAPVATVNLIVSGVSSIVADGVATTTLEATVLDGSANPLPNRSVTINIPTDGGTIAVNPVNSNASGVASFTLTSSLVVGVYGYTATSESVNSGNQNVTFTAIPVDSVSLAVTGATTILADGSATTTLEATVLDASSNPLAGRNVTLNIPTDGGTTANPAVTNASGVASFTLTSSLVAGLYNYTATSEAVNSNSESVTFVAPVATVNLIVSGVSSIVADGVATTTLEATVLDGSANPLPGRSVTINIPTDGGTISVNPVVSNASGVASFTLTSSLVVGVYGYTATSESVNSGNQNVTFTTIPVDSVVLAVTGLVSIAADGVATTTLEATVRDASSNLLAGRNVTLNIPTDGGTTANPAVTNASGVASFTLTSSLVAGLYNYTATSEAVNSNSESVTFVAPVATVNLIVSGVSSIVADGVATTTLEATVLDGSANPLPGRSVTINIPTDGGTISVNPVVSNASGVASFTLTSSLVVGVYGYTATSESINSGNQNVTFTAIPVDSVSLAVTGGTSILADGAATTTFEATVLDASSNPLAGRSVTINIPTDGGTIGVNPANTNASGVASFTLTSSLVAGVYAYTATSEAVNSAIENVTFTAVPIDSVTLAITGSTSIVANGSASTTLEATVLDASSNPLSNRSVTINIPTDGGTIAVNPANTNASGVASFTLTSSLVAGVYGYTATSESVNSGSQNVTFIAPVATVTLAVTGANSIAVGGNTTTLEATVRDGSSNLLSGRSVFLNIPTDGGTVATNPVVTNGSGIAVFTLSSSAVPGVYSYTATSEAVSSSSQNVTFTATVAVIEWDVSSYDFGTVSVAVTQTFTLTNTGTAVSGTITVNNTGPGSKWAIITDNCSTTTLAVSANCTVSYEYDGGRNPTGTHNSTLDATATPGGNVTINVTGTTP